MPVVIGTYLEKTTWHLNNRWSVLRAAFCNSNHVFWFDHSSSLWVMLLFEFEFCCYSSSKFEMSFVTIRVSKGPVKLSDQELYEQPRLLPAKPNHRQKICIWKRFIRFMHYFTSCWRLVDGWEDSLGLAHNFWVHIFSSRFVTNWIFD